MSTPLVEASVQGIELENWAKMIPDLVFKADTLYTRIKKAAKSYPSANITKAGGIGRPAFRVPMRVQAAAAIQQSNPDGGSLGRGTGSLWISGDISPVFLSNGCEITHLTELATEGPKRAMVSVRAQELKNSLTSFLNGIESLAQGDSSGSVLQLPTSSVVTTGLGTSSISGLLGGTVAQVQDQQVIDFYDTEGGALKGTGTVSFADTTDNTIYFSTDLATVTGLASGSTYFLMVHGSGGAVGDSLAGIKTYQVNGNAGSVLNLLRANFPGRLSTSLIDLGGKAVNPAVPYRAEILVKRALGPDTEAAKELVWYGGPGQRLAITGLYQGILSQNNIYEGGNKAGDVVKRDMTTRFGDREYIESYNATPGRIDGLCLGNWGVVEAKEPSLYTFGNGVTTMPVPDPSGAGWLASNIFYYEAFLNFFNSNMRAGVIVQGAAEPTI
jgi:hypothetical protein